jgi:uncharacterized protein DUF3489
VPLTVASRARGLSVQLTEPPDQDPPTRRSGAKATSVCSSSLDAIGVIGQVDQDPDAGTTSAGRAADAATAAGTAERGSPAAEGTGEAQERQTGHTATRTKTREGTKQAQLVAMLRRAEGATIAQIVAAAGWQPHTVRGAFAGALKKLGLTVTSEKVDRTRVYRLGS